MADELEPQEDTLLTTIKEAAEEATGQPFEIVEPERPDPNFLPPVTMASTSGMEAGTITTPPEIPVDEETRKLQQAAQAFALGTSPMGHAVISSTLFEQAYTRAVQDGGQDLADACKSQCRYQSMDCASYMDVCIRGALENQAVKAKVLAEWRIHVGDDIKALERAVAATEEASPATTSEPSES